MSETQANPTSEDQLAREELESLLEELGVSVDSAKDEYRNKVESLNKLTLWQDQHSSQIAQLSTP